MWVGVIIVFTIIYLCYCINIIIFAVDCATVPVVFVGESGEQVYSLDWTELLTVAGDSHFQSVDDLSLGTKVMAPWCDKTNHSVVQYSEATVVEGGLTGVCLKHCTSYIQIKITNVHTSPTLVTAPPSTSHK